MNEDDDEDYTCRICNGRGEILIPDGIRPGENETAINGRGQIVITCENCGGTGEERHYYQDDEEYQ